jgi:hypothetical protein
LNEACGRKKKRGRPLSTAFFISALVKNFLSSFKSTFMSTHFLQQYAAIYKSIPGYFTLDAALMFIAYNQLLTAQGVNGDILEIGVHHGRSAIVIGSFTAPGRKFVAVDLFDQLQELNASGSGSGNRKEFLRNMGQFFSDLTFIQTIEGASSSVSVNALGNQFSFCHIDGGHSPEETYNDLNLCCQLLRPGGLLALDDYFNPAFPGVSEGAVQFKLEQGDQLKPVAIGFNKVLFQKNGTDLDLPMAFSLTFPMIPHERSVLWGREVNHFTTGLTKFINLVESTPRWLVPSEEGWVQAIIEPESERLEGLAGETIKTNVKVTNKSKEPLPFGEAVFGLSYHLMTSDETMVKYDNARSYFMTALQPEESSFVELVIQVPGSRGSFIVELDLVWEGMHWFKENGNPTAKIELVVK